MSNCQLPVVSAVTYFPRFEGCPSYSPPGCRQFPPWAVCLPVWALTAGFALRRLTDGRARGERSILMLDLVELLTPAARRPLSGPVIRWASIIRRSLKYTAPAIAPVIEPGGGAAGAEAVGGVDRRVVSWCSRRRGRRRGRDRAAS